MVMNRRAGNPLRELRPVLTREQLVHLQDVVEQTFLSDSVIRYIVDLVGATRSHEAIARGASPRATLAVASMARAIAQLRGRDYVVPGDVREVFIQTVAHRLILSPRAESQGRQSDQILREILEAVPTPRLH